MTYPTLEHGFMHIKCVMNDDITSARSILDSPELYIGQTNKEIRSRSTNIFGTTRRVRKSYLGYCSQNYFLVGSNLARELLETGNKHLAESGRNNHYA